MNNNQIKIFDENLATKSNAVGGAEPWVNLRDFTTARIAIGRAGGSQRTPSILDFRMAHAKAKDAVNSKFDTNKLQEELKEAGFESELFETMLSDKATYLMQPDLGRRLNDGARSDLLAFKEKYGDKDFAIIVSDGLSANAVMSHSVATIKEILKHLPVENWSTYPIIVVPFARVKVQDDIGEILGVRHSIILIGERPGLGSPDSMSAYFTYKPTRASVESDRNCISNIRPKGMPIDIASLKIATLLKESLRLQISGTSLKDNIDISSLADSGKNIALL